MVVTKEPCLSLAYEGGTPVRKKPWPLWPHYDSDEIEAVCKVLESGKVNYWTGQHGHAFENEMAHYLGVKYAVALANGSLALELALAVLQIGQGDEVVVPSRTFIATASACVMRGARPVFADIDPVSQNITAQTIRAALTHKTKAIICVHLAGWACEMDEILKLAKERGCYVIEDCAQCIGGAYRGRLLGSIGDFGAFSFCQDKIVTTGGEGGMLVMNKESWYKKAWSYKDHGKDFDVYNNGIKKRSLYTALGTNWRLTEMQSAIGRLQLKKLNGWISLRTHNASMLSNALRDMDGIRLTLPPVHIQHAYYKYYIFLKKGALAKSWSRDRVVAAINAEGVLCAQGSTWAIGREAGWKTALPVGSKKIVDMQEKRNFHHDKEVGTSSLMFQVHPTLGTEEIQDTIRSIKKVMQVALRR